LTLSEYEPYREYGRLLAHMPTKTITATSSSTAVSQPTMTYAWYVVVVLLACYTLSFIDRQILSLLVGPIKQDLGITDTRIGLLQGLAFAIFYTFLGMPVGRLADNFSRRTIISAGVFFWSLMTGTCAVARSFWSLFAARIGVGVGEATLSPSAFSLIADYFPKERLATAVSVYSMGIFIGSGLANIVGGMVVDAVKELPAVHLPVFGAVPSWRLTFLIVGIPGVLIALLVYTIREPLRQQALRTADGRVSKLSLGDVLSEMRLRWQSVVGVSLALAFQSSCNYALLAWAPTFFIRVHGWTPGQAGSTLGTVILFMGCAGAYVGGRLSDRWQRQGVRESTLRVGYIASAGAAIFASAAMSAPSSSLTVALLVPALFFLSLPVGSSYASLQIIFPNQLRGQVSAVFLFAITLIGLTLGPLWPALLNDYVFGNGNMVGYSVAITVGISSVITAILFRMSYGPYRRHHAMLHG
jgi:MFS family permease